VASGGPARRAENQPGKKQPHSRAYDQKLGMNLGDRPGNGRGPNHPSHNARYAEKQDKSEQQLERAVSGQSSGRYRFRVSWVGLRVHPISLIPFDLGSESETIATETPNPQFAQDGAVRLIGTGMPVVER